MPPSGKAWTTLRWLPGVWYIQGHKDDLHALRRAGAAQAAHVVVLQSTGAGDASSWEGFAPSTAFTSTMRLARSVSGLQFATVKHLEAAIAQAGGAAGGAVSSSALTGVPLLPTGGAGATTGHGVEVLEYDTLACVMAVNAVEASRSHRKKPHRRPPSALRRSQYKGETAATPPPAVATSTPQSHATPGSSMSARDLAALASDLRAAIRGSGAGAGAGAGAAASMDKPSSPAFAQLVFAETDEAFTYVPGLVGAYPRHHVCSRVVTHSSRHVTVDLHHGENVRFLLPCIRRAMQPGVCDRGHAHAHELSPATGVSGGGVVAAGGGSHARRAQMGAVITARRRVPPILSPVFAFGSMVSERLLVTLTAQACRAVTCSPSTHLADNGAVSCCFCHGAGVL